MALDEVGLGLRTSREGRAVDAAGRPDPTLFIAGPLARGAFGELMGLPQVANHARSVAEQIAGALAAKARAAGEAASASRP